MFHDPIGKLPEPPGIGRQPQPGRQMARDLVIQHQQPVDGKADVRDCFVPRRSAPVMPKLTAPFRNELPHRVTVVTGNR
jgi:hypothetical protein